MAENDRHVVGISTAEPSPLTPGMRRVLRANSTALEETNDRQKSRTSAQMLAAPKGALFIWCNGNLAYPRALAKHLGRSDLIVKAPAFFAITGGVRFPALVVDHAAVLTDYQSDRRAELERCIAMFTHG